MDELIKEFIGWCAVVLTVGIVAYLFHVSYSDAGFVLAVVIIALVVPINLWTRLRSR
jgi:hypothetical protein